MTCKFNVRRGFMLGCILSLLGACAGSASPSLGGPDGGVAGTLDTIGGDEHLDSVGGRLDPGEVGDAGQGGRAALGAAGSADDEASEAGRGGDGGASATAGASGAGAAGADLAGGSGGSAGAVSELMIPCDVYAAYRVCRNCHVNPPINGAPMALLTLLDLQMFADMEYQAVSTGVMPAAGTLSAQEAELILGWLAAGARGVPQAPCP
ncbi:MAG: hypothetical protein WDO74_17140 [Pseudomonadota bacterium]